jgi:pre-rRNA-processing protein TSR1
MFQTNQDQTSNRGVGKKQHVDVFKSLLSFIQYFVPTQQRVCDLAIPTDALNALRSISEGRPSAVKWREGRPWLLAGDVTWENGNSAVPASSENDVIKSPITCQFNGSLECLTYSLSQDPLGTLTVQGVVRGGHLSADRLVHIANAGDFQIEQVSVIVLISYSLW